MKILPTLTIHRLKAASGAYLAGGTITHPAWSYAEREALAFPTHEHATAAKSLLRVWLDRAGYPSSAITVRESQAASVTIPHSEGVAIHDAGAALVRGVRYALPLYVDGAPDWLFGQTEKGVTA